MKKFATIFVALAFALLLASPSMAIETCPQGISNIYQYSVATTPGAHQSHFQAVVSAANAHCDALYGSNPNYMGVSISLNSACTSFSVSCQICNGGGIGPYEYPMALSDAVAISDGNTGSGNGGVIVGAGQVILDRFDRFVPGFLVEYANPDNSAGLTVMIDAETGEVETAEPRKVTPRKVMDK